MLLLLPGRDSVDTRTPKASLASRTLCWKGLVTRQKVAMSCVQQIFVEPICCRMTRPFFTVKGVACMTTPLIFLLLVQINKHYKFDWRCFHTDSAAWCLWKEHQQEAHFEGIANHHFHNSNLSTSNSFRTFFCLCSMQLWKSECRNMEGKMQSVLEIR